MLKMSKMSKMSMSLVADVSVLPTTLFNTDLKKLFSIEQGLPLQEQFAWLEWVGLRSIALRMKSRAKAARHPQLCHPRVVRSVGRIT